MCSIRALAIAVMAAMETCTWSLESAEAGTIEVGDTGGISFSGEVRPDDVAQLKAAILAEKESGRLVVLTLFDSPGGDVMAAIEIGRFVRENAVWTMAGRCNSSCVLVLMGGVSRLVLGDLGIHRPKFDESYFAGLSEAGARAEYQRLSATVEAYLAEMGADLGLFQQMMRVPSGQIRFLTLDEAEAFAIQGRDPNYEEWIRAKKAQKLGLESLQKLEACQQSQDYEDWISAMARYLGECSRKADSGACTKDAIRLFPDPCAPLRRRSQP